MLPWQVEEFMGPAHDVVLADGLPLRAHLDDIGLAVLAPATPAALCGHEVARGSDDDSVAR